MTNSIGNPTNPGFTLGNFIVGESNHTTFEASRDVAEKPGEIYNPLVLCGRCGLGKSECIHRRTQILLPDITVLFGDN